MMREPDIRCDANVCSNFEDRNPWRSSQRDHWKCGFMLACCFWLEGCCFNEGRVQKVVAMLRPEFLTFHTETFGTKKRNCTEFGGTKIRNEMSFPLRCRAFFTILHFQNCRKINVRNVPADGALLIRLPLVTCTTPTEHDEFTRVSWPADGATFPWPAVIPKANSCIHPT